MSKPIYKRLFSVLARVLLAFLVLLTIFYFWGSSASLDKQDYEKLFTNTFEVKHESDSIHSIITYNIGYLSGMTNNKPIAKTKDFFTENLNKALQEFKKLNPDIIAFQEIDYNSGRSFNVNQEEEIAKLGYNHIARAVNWDKKYVPFPYGLPSVNFGKVVSGQSILSKYELKNYSRIILERVPNNPFYRDAFYLDRLVQVVTTEIKGKEIVILNVHLEAFDKNTRIKHVKKVVELFNTYAKSYPTILVGDFNSDPAFKDAAILEIFNIPNVGNAAFSKEKYDLTYDSDKPHKRLDYIFYTSENIVPVEARVLKEFGQVSDHLPLLMKFKLK
ncbi:endonuclease/exonuclease/phosphatase family protein [Tenacibaculum jejuense]|uniref:Endonuclease/exonuclease/phosphatase family protein n=1 Tax=Tenacibaculum jejuense TaxID=584609 RepID=A0A238UFM6_9FLAO|nr:endonuclease/exonuclease/phosphatase family protein [Tenacibaculum jejuense]SNR17180.1 Endonuclease/exonuclease/phosphatase family protein [Tenacibaculum jejuense]